MGGPGSGGWNRTGRGTVEDCPALDVNRLRRAGVLAEGWHGLWRWRREDAGTLDATLRGGRERIRIRPPVRAEEGGPSVEEAIAVLWRPCPFGGARPAFACPGCQQPARKLYLVHARFRCRRCHALTYASQREREHQRARRRVRRLRQRLGVGPGDARLPRPRGMHRRTHARLTRRIKEWEAAADDLAARMMLHLLERLERRSPRSFWP